MSIEDATGMEFRSAYVIPPAYDDIYVLPTEEVTTGSFLLTTRWRKGEPMFSLGTPGGKTTFDTLLQPGSLLDTATDNAATVYAGTGRGERLPGPGSQGQDRGRRAERRGDARGARPGGRRGRSTGADRRQRRRRWPDGVRRRRVPPGRQRAPRRRGEAGRDGQDRCQAGREAGQEHRLRLRPDPRVPGPRPGPCVGLHAAAARPRQDRRQLLRRQGRPGLGLPVRRDAEPVARLRRARGAPGHAGRVGDSRAAVGRVARAEHRRCAAVADGVGRQLLRTRARPRGSTGSGRPSVPASATPSGSRTPAGATT